MPPAAAFSADPEHEYDFRGCSDGAVVDTYDGNLQAAQLHGAHCSAEGMVFDGVDDYVALDPWEFGGAAMSAEVVVKYQSLNSYSRVFDFGDGERLK